MDIMVQMSIKNKHTIAQLAIHKEECRLRNMKESAEDVTKDKADGDKGSRVQKEKCERESRRRFKGQRSWRYTKKSTDSEL